MTKKIIALIALTASLLSPVISCADNANFYSVASAYISTVNSYTTFSQEAVVTADGEEVYAISVVGKKEGAREYVTRTEKRPCAFTCENAYIESTEEYYYENGVCYQSADGEWKPLAAAKTPSYSFSFVKSYFSDFNLSESSGGTVFNGKLKKDDARKFFMTELDAEADVTATLSGKKLSELKVFFVDGNYEVCITASFDVNATN